jgi:hypothetical protein
VHKIRETKSLYVRMCSCSAPYSTGNGWPIESKRSRQKE